MPWRVQSVFLASKCNNLIKKYLKNTILTHFKGVKYKSDKYSPCIYPHTKFQIILFAVFELCVASHACLTSIVDVLFIQFKKETISIQGIEIAQNDLLLSAKIQVTYHLSFLQLPTFRFLIKRKALSTLIYCKRKVCTSFE